MKTRVIMPQLGESVVEGTVSRWLKHEGEHIREYEPLVEISTDKVDTEIPAPATGMILQVYVAEGETVAAGTLLAEIGEPGADSDNDSDDQPARSGARKAGNGHHAARSYTGHVTPVVARMVAEHDIDLGRIEGTGRGGRVTKRDVEAYLSADEAPAAEPAESPAWERPGSGDLFKPTVDYGAEDAAEAEKEAPPPAAKTAEPAAPRRVHPVEAVPQGAPGELVGLTPLRKAIAEHMVHSKLQTAPHVTTVFEADLTAVLAHREAHKEAFARQGVNLTLTAYFAAGTITALQQNPYLNARWTDEGIYLHHPVHLGIAVAIDGGLIVPVIKNAQDLNLMGIARAVNDLAQRARDKQLQPDDVKGGTFTITNHGVSGSLFATPIINQPQAGILGVGVMEKRVKVINDAITIRPCCYISLTFDHRIADGAAGDSFMLTLKETLERWS